MRHLSFPGLDGCGLKNPKSSVLRPRSRVAPRSLDGFSCAFASAGSFGHGVVSPFTGGVLRVLSACLFLHGRHVRKAPVIRIFLYDYFVGRCVLSSLSVPFSKRVGKALVSISLCVKIYLDDVSCVLRACSCQGPCIRQEIPFLPIDK